MLEHTQFVATESDLFNVALQRIWQGSNSPSSVRVPSCPDWSAADLAWHLAEVQYFWASIVEGSLTDPSEVVPLDRPSDDQLLTLHANEAERLVAVLADRDPLQPCWSWDGGLQDVAWVRRRQAHEALIHRIDAELTADIGGGEPVGQSPIDEALAADGVDEMLSVMLDVGDELPSWATFESDGTVVQLRAPDRRWLVTLGALTGTDEDGTDQHLRAIRLLDEAYAATPEPAATVTCAASTLDLWLWRRSPLTDATIVGDENAVEHLYEITDLS